MNLLDTLIQESREISRIKKTKKTKGAKPLAKTLAGSDFLAEFLEKERKASLSQLEAAREYLRGWRATERVIVILQTTCTACNRSFESPGANAPLLRRTNQRTGDIWESPIKDETPTFLSQLPLVHRTLNTTVSACHHCHAESPALQTSFTFTEGLRPRILLRPGPAQRIHHYV